MNPFKKLYCRAFQIVFRLALPLLPYRNPECLGKAEDVPALLRDKGLRRPLLVTDRTLRELGLTRDLEQALEQAGFPPAIFADTCQNPTTKTVEAAVAVYRQEHCDCLIAFGGGSPMDCAKAAGAMIALPGKRLYQMAGILKVRRKTPTLIAIPTTAGTGSETTLAAVIVDEETRHKYVINSFPLIPDYAVLDARTIHTLPHHIAATTGMDATTHAVEAYIGRSTTRETRRDAVRAVKLIFDSIEAASSHLDSLSEQNMLLAAYADKEANPLYPVPILWGPKHLETIYRKVGKPNGS